MNIATETKCRKVVGSEGRRIIANVYHYLKREYQFMHEHQESNGELSHILRNISQRTADATGISVRTVQRILREEKELPSPTSEFPSPMKNRRRRDCKVDIDNATGDVIRSTINELYVVHKEIPTLAKIKSVLAERIGFDGCIETLRKILLNLGYKWRKTENNKKVLVLNVNNETKRKKLKKEEKMSLQ